MANMEQNLMEPAARTTKMKVVRPKVWKKQVPPENCCWAAYSSCCTNPNKLCLQLDCKYDEYTR
jgi:hypothetical protein